MGAKEKEKKNERRVKACLKNETRRVRLVSEGEGWGPSQERKKKAWQAKEGSEGREGVKVSEGERSRAKVRELRKVNE